MELKETKHVGFNEKPEIIALIDAAAESEGLDRSGFMKQAIRARLRSEADAIYTK
jgi:uncharacterized protein (DUF1778 family)